MQSRLDLDQNRHCVGPDLGLNPLQKLTADDTSIQWISSGFNMNKRQLPYFSQAIREGSIDTALIHRLN